MRKCSPLSRASACVMGARIFSASEHCSEARLRNHFVTCTDEKLDNKVCVNLVKIALKTS